MTTITDNFNRADGAIGSSSEGWSWANAQGSFSIVSNAAVPGTGGQNNCRAESDLSSSDHYSEAVVTYAGVADDVGVAARFATAANTAYLYLNDGGNDRIYKVIAGAYTSLTALATAAPTAVTFRLECSGTAIAGKRNGTTRVSTTDSSITTGTRCGIRAYNDGGSASTIDSFVAADLAAGDVTAALSGSSSTASAGTLVSNVAMALTGQAATASAGTLSPDVSIALTGQSATASAGTVTVETGTVIALTGASVTASAGTLAPSVSVALTGSSVTASAGTVTNDGVVVAQPGGGSGGRYRAVRRIFTLPNGMRVLATESEYERLLNPNPVSDFIPEPTKDNDNVFPIRDNIYESEINRRLQESIADMKEIRMAQVVEKLIEAEDEELLVSLWM